MGEEKEEVSKKEKKTDLRKKAVKEAMKAWNDLIAGQLQSFAAWEKYCELRTEEKIDLQEFPLKAQKVLWLANPLGDYSFMLEDLITQPPIKDFLREQLLGMD